VSTAPAPRLRPDLARLPAYRAGSRPQPGGAPVFSLASNESPFPPSAAVLAAIAQAAATTNRYPDPGSTALVAALARRLAVDPAMIAVGTGSVALCSQLATAAAGPGEEIVFAWRSFEAYPIVAGAAGAAAVPVPLLPDGRHDLPAMAAAVTPATRLVFLCSPNNPTGPVLHQDEVEAFLAAVPDDLLVVIDEAYWEYITDPLRVDGVELARRCRNVIALRTFSKAYGLAGLRVGYGVGDPDLVARLRLVALPFGVSRVAEAAAIAALGDADAAAANVAGTVAERSRVLAGLQRCGWPVPQAQGNFVWLPLGSRSGAFADACRRAGFTVRPFPGEGVRVSIGEPAANDRFLALADEWPA
jgi:histidinol-phosphate aminotransferase